MAIYTAKKSNGNTVSWNNSITPELFRLRQGERNMDQGALGNNLRPQQAINNRILRTNIGIPAQQVAFKDIKEKYLKYLEIAYLLKIELKVHSVSHCGKIFGNSLFFKNLQFFLLY